MLGLRGGGGKNPPTNFLVCVLFHFYDFQMPDFFEFYS